MEIQIIDVDYVMLENRPLLRIFGKTIEGKNVCAFYEGFYPYFFVDRDPSEIIGNDAQIEKVKKIPLYEKYENVWKVTITNPGNIPAIRQKLENAGFVCYEADVLFKYRFMADFELSGFGWIEIENGKEVRTTTVKCPAINVKAFKPIEKSEDIKLKVLAFDIECFSENNNIPDAKKDPIILISFAFNENWKGKKTLVLSTKLDAGVEILDSETEMIQTFFDIINEYDPDIITGYNCNNFDFPYILERAERLGIKTNFGRCAQKPVFIKRIGQKCRISIPGRVVVDSYEIIKKDFFLQRYSLDFVAPKLLGEKKVEVRHSQISQLWKNGGDGFRKLVEYSEKDAWLALELFLRLNLIDKYIALSKVAGTLLQDTLDGGETARIEQYVLREFNKYGYVLPCKPSSSIIEKRKMQALSGGEVLEPLKGLHSNIAVLDFKSMYPSIICAFNICPSTLTKEKEGNIITPSGACFLAKEKKIGIIPRIEARLMEERQLVKKKIKKIKDEKIVRALDMHQWALKILANAFYGYFGYARSRLYNLEIANAITSSGRSIILKTKAFIENTLGKKVVYGDTDSLFIQLKEGSFEQQVAEAKEVAELAAKQLPSGMELDFEKIFKRFLPLTKKRYAALALRLSENGFEETIETKGIETVRRDWCDLVGITTKGVLEILLKQNNVKAAVQYFKGVIEKLLKGETPIETLIITKTITKSPKAYAGVQPHIELAKKIESRSPGEMPGIGDRIGYVIIKGAPNTLLSKRAEDPAYVVEKGLPIDCNYYIVNQLLPPIERIFNSLGISKTELLGTGRQVGLFDMFVKPGTDIFSCSHCGKGWQRPPLSGICECGAAF